LLAKMNRHKKFAGIFGSFAEAIDGWVATQQWESPDEDRSTQFRVS